MPEHLNPQYRRERTLSITISGLWYYTYKDILLIGIIILGNTLCYFELNCLIRRDDKT
jgi:hypothetical protein